MKRKGLTLLLTVMLVILSPLSLLLAVSCQETEGTFNGVISESKPKIVVTNFGNVRGYDLIYYHDTVHKVGIWMHGTSVFVLPDSQYLIK